MYLDGACPCDQINEQLRPINRKGHKEKEGQRRRLLKTWEAPKAKCMRDYPANATNHGLDQLRLLVAHLRIARVRGFLPTDAAPRVQVDRSSTLPHEAPCEITRKLGYVGMSTCRDSGFNSQPVEQGS